ncbi:hypothetical protein BDF22DRAFT_694655 [Syncephalis plumigaleata]|nr:hypothetical protein BDF22DRAFT_694655 [Syncephalis plumigaleata]
MTDSVPDDSSIRGSVAATGRNGHTDGLLATRREKRLSPLLIDSSRLKLQLPVEKTKTPFDFNKFLEQRPGRSLKELRDELEKMEQANLERRLDIILADCEQFVRIPSVVTQLPNQIHEVASTSDKIKQRLEMAHTQIKYAYNAWEHTSRALQQQQQVATRLKQLITLSRDMNRLEEITQQITAVENTKDAHSTMQEAMLERSANLYHYIAQACQELTEYKAVDRISQRLSTVQDLISSSIVQELQTALQKLYREYGKNDKDKRQEIVVWDSTIMYYQIFKQIGKQSVAHTLLISEYITPFLAMRLSLRSYAERRVAIMKDNKHPLSVLLSETYQLLLEQLTPLLRIDPLLQQQTIWPQFLRSIPEKMSFLFSLDELDRFAEHYQVFQQWLLQQSNALDGVEYVKDSSAANALRNLIRHWPLDQYFEARFYEMTELLDTAILKSSQINVTAVSQSTTTDMPVLPITSATLTLIELCWSSRVNLPPLMARFWKLCCQFMLRYGAWLAEWCSENAIQTVLDNEKQIKLISRAKSPILRVSSRNATTNTTITPIASPVNNAEMNASEIQLTRKRIAEADIDWLRGQLVDLLQLTVRPAIPIALQSRAVQLLEALMAKVSQLDAN